MTLEGYLCSGRNPEEPYWTAEGERLGGSWRDGAELQGEALRCTERAENRILAIPSRSVMTYTLARGTGRRARIRRVARLRLQRLLVRAPSALTQRRH